MNGPLATAKRPVRVAWVAVAALAAAAGPLRAFLLPSFADWVFAALLAWLFYGARGAQTLLAELNKASGNQNPETLWLAAQVAKRLQQWGNAKAALEALLELNSADSAARVALADVELTLNRPEAAMVHLLAAQKNHLSLYLMAVYGSERNAEFDVARSSRARVQGTARARASVSHSAKRGSRGAASCGQSSHSCANAAAACSRLRRWRSSAAASGTM